MRTIDTSLGFPLIEDDKCWKIHLEELRLFTGLSVLARILGDQILDHMETQFSDISFSYKINPNINPELLQMQIVAIQVYAKSGELDDIIFHIDEFHSHLRTIFGTLYESKWLILLIMTVTVLIGFTKTQLDRPIYKADGLLQVKENSTSMAGLEPLAGLIEGKMAVMAEIELIKSRMILGKTIKSLHLDVIAKPRYFPIVGETIARQFQNRNQDGSVSNPLFGLTQYAWGGETIQVETFIVPSILEDEEFILKTDQEGFFKLFYKDEIILEGEEAEKARNSDVREKGSIKTGLM